jgi:hypothetical protein
MYPWRQDTMTPPILMTAQNTLLIILMLLRDVHGRQAKLLLSLLVPYLPLLPISQIYCFIIHYILFHPIVILLPPSP